MELRITVNLTKDKMVNDIIAESIRQALQEITFSIGEFKTLSDDTEKA